MRLVFAVIGTALVLGTAGCSSRDQEKTKEEVREDAHKTAEDAKKAGREIKQDAKDLSQRVSAAVQPDSRSASDKFEAGTDRMKVAAAKAGVKLDHAALLAEVKTKLASDAGLSTLTRVDVALHGSEVTLSGTVATEEQKKAAELAAAQVHGVTHVHNALIVQP